MPSAAAAAEQSSSVRIEPPPLSSQLAPDAKVVYEKYCGACGDGGCDGGDGDGGGGDGDGGGGGGDGGSGGGAPGGDGGGFGGRSQAQCAGWSAAASWTRP